MKRRQQDSSRRLLQDLLRRLLLGWSLRQALQVALWTAAGLPREVARPPRVDLAVAVVARARDL